MKMRLKTKFGFSLGMISAIVYMAHVFIGQMLWPEYNPITTDISSLTANGAPNSEILHILTFIYGICFILFVICLLIYSIKNHHKVTTTGYVLMFIMALITNIGYYLFPLTGDKTEMNFQNMMHIVVTVLVVFTTIGSLFVLAYGFLKKEKNKKLGRVCLVFGILIFVFGAMNPISMANNLNILGLTERLVIFTLQGYVFLWSFLYTFKVYKEI